MAKRNVCRNGVGVRSPIYIYYLEFILFPRVFWTKLKWRGSIESSFCVSMSSFVVFLPRIFYILFYLISNNITLVLTKLKAICVGFAFFSYRFSGFCRIVLYRDCIIGYPRLQRQGCSQLDQSDNVALVFPRTGLLLLSVQDQRNKLFSTKQFAYYPDVDYF